MDHVFKTCDVDIYVDAEGQPEWENAMSAKYDSLMKNKTWDLVP